ncbi:MAG: DUF4331 family protein [bacterium]
MRKLLLVGTMALAGLALLLSTQSSYVDASSHREAPLISTDPLADNTDLYVFRSPDRPNWVTIAAGYIGLELPEGGPNYATFGQNVRYEIHIKNKPSLGALGTATDDITYRFTFNQTNEDPNTFFNIRLGQNLKTTYTCEKSTDGGNTFTTIVSNGIVPPNNIGARSTTFAGGAGGNYEALVTPAITTASTGEVVFCGPRDDPFFVDLGGVFDLGATRSNYGTDPGNAANARDAVAGYNCHYILLQIPINQLQKDGKNVAQASGILDPEFVIGVWASASRQQVTTLSPLGGRPTPSGPWVQVSRLGMPLTNEAVIPIKDKDFWNAVTPYSTYEQDFVKYFANPELSLYMQNGSTPSEGLGDLVPSLAPLRVQTMSYPALGVIPPATTPGLDFRLGKDGAFAVTRLNPAPNLAGTAFAVPTRPEGAPGAGTALVGPGQPRLVDVFPVFYFGVPNAIPYQLATGKTGGPLSAGKPFIHNFLPLTQTATGALWGGDVLRLNMATPTTDRNSSEFTQNARMGLVRAAVLGLTTAPYNTSTNVEFIPHMDGFPNGRRLEDDVTTIELQAVGGLVLAAVGLPFDDAVSPVYADLASPKLVAELTYVAGPQKNDLPLLAAFPYLATPHRGYDYVKQLTTSPTTSVTDRGMGIGVPKGFILQQNYPNPFNPSTEIKYTITRNDRVRLRIFNQLGQEVAMLVDQPQTAGVHSVKWDAKGIASGTYFYRLEVGDQVMPAKKAILIK